MKINDRLPISVVILTYNEEANIEACLNSIHGWVKDIFIIDSFSTDKTVSIASKYTSNIYKHEFTQYFEQLNWAFKELPISSEWIMRLDADEVITTELKEELFKVFSCLDLNVCGLYTKRKLIFMDKWIRYGGYYPIWLLRIFKKDSANCEKRFMDEHIILKKGACKYLKNAFIDKNNKDLQWWIKKHNNYSSREAVDLLNIEYNFYKRTNFTPKDLLLQAPRKRILKESVYVRLPLFFRVFLYFLYRYFIRLGFLDGLRGLIWHFLQGFWYRFLVDAKIFMVKRKVKLGSYDIKEVIKSELGMDCRIMN